MNVSKRMISTSYFDLSGVHDNNSDVFVCYSIYNRHFLPYRLVIATLPSEVRNDYHNPSCGNLDS